MNKEAFLLLVNKYLAGTASPEEEQLLMNYFDSFRQSTAWDEATLGPRADLERSLLQRIQSGITTVPQKRVVRMSPVRWMAAAVVLLALAASFFLLKNQLLPHPVHMQEAVTQPGERRQVHLQDGTEVWMEPGSRLVYPEQFDGDTREITLSGGAFFEVAKNPLHLFIIHTGTLDTRVLGTSFNVKAYTPFSQEVTVVTGSVAVQPARKTGSDTAQVILVPNQLVAWNAQSHRLEKTVLPNTAYYAQRRFGKFIYEGETIATVLDDIRRQYNVEIWLDSPAFACTFYGDFDVRQDVDKVLNALAATLNAHVKKEARGGWTISGGGCASQGM
ncbi:MAG: FecR domain-containing protein [Bacteroidetes bacterium]|nr:FecR domain-containing protein [Bacteroidota bacterium]